MSLIADRTVPLPGVVGGQLKFSLIDSIIVIVPPSHMLYMMDRMSFYLLLSTFPFFFGVILFGLGFCRKFEIYHISLRL